MGLRGRLETNEEVSNFLGVDADGNLVRYQWGAYDGMQNKRMIYFINLGGTAEV
jgi:hypothetical protein